MHLPIDDFRVEIPRVLNVHQIAQHLGVRRRRRRLGQLVMSGLRAGLDAAAGAVAVGRCRGGADVGQQCRVAASFLHLYEPRARWNNGGDGKPVSWVLRALIGKLN